MGKNTCKPDVAKVLAGLKDFQRVSVEYVFSRLYGAHPTRRFLVADEVYREFTYDGKTSRSVLTLDRG